jgi:O-antigen ligase
MLTQSRAGLFVTGLSSIIYLPYLASQWIAPSSKFVLTRRRLTACGAVALVVVFIAIFGGRAILRADQRGADDDRFCIWSDTMHSLSDNWLQGTGFGTFRTVFSAYRTSNCGIGGIIDRAHNSYLEGFLTLGILSPIITCLIFLVLLQAFWIGYRGRRRLRHYSLLGCVGTLLAAAHSVVDFSIQIPGFAIFFMAFLANAISICCGREERIKENGKDVSFGSEFERPTDIPKYDDLKAGYT